MPGLRDVVTGSPIAQDGTDTGGMHGPGHVAEQNNTAGLQNPGTSNIWARRYSEFNLAICDGTSAVPVEGSSAANDTLLGAILILKDAGPATATVAGLGKTTNGTSFTAASFVLTGSTSVDTVFNFYGCKNRVGALTVTGSVDEKVITLARSA